MCRIAYYYRSTSTKKCIDPAKLDDWNQNADEVIKKSIPLLVEQNAIIKRIISNGGSINFESTKFYRTGSGNEKVNEWNATNGVPSEQSALTMINRMNMKGKQFDCLMIQGLTGVTSISTLIRLVSSVEVVVFVEVSSPQDFTPHMFHATDVVAALNGDLANLKRFEGMCKLSSTSSEELGCLVDALEKTRVISSALQAVLDAWKAATNRPLVRVIISSIGGSIAREAMSMAGKLNTGMGHLRGLAIGLDTDEGWLALTAARGLL
jgi:hypothetical protein